MSIISTISPLIREHVNTLKCNKFSNIKTWSEAICNTDETNIINVGYNLIGSNLSNRDLNQNKIVLSENPKMYFFNPNTVSFEHKELEVCYNIIKSYEFLLGFYPIEDCSFDLYVNHNLYKTYNLTKNNFVYVNEDDGISVISLLKCDDVKFITNDNHIQIKVLLICATAETSIRKRYTELDNIFKLT